MNRLFTLLLVLGLAMMAGTSRAESISESQARNIAAGFMATHQMAPGNLRVAPRGPQLNTPATGDKTAYYVFNAERGGYVIVAGDDRAPAVLGYSDRGAFDATQIPEAMQELLEGYAAQIEDISQGAKPVLLLTTGPAISPLVSANWSQNSPYSTLLPVVNDKHVPAGCVATAMAQVMYYWKWPARPTKTIPAYTTTALSIDMPALAPVNFEWDLMQDTYLSTDSTTAAGLAAARLTLYCAQSVEMNFRENTSSATTTRAPLAMSTYFGYKGSMHSLSRVNYTSQQWADIIYGELSEGRPVIYSASKKSGGHAFVCDGYDGNGMFHINWGWNGQSNGYFLLNVLNPDLQGTGSASGSYGYIYSQAIIVGIEPGEGSYSFALTSSNVTLDAYTSTRTGSNYNFSATVSGRFYNFTSQAWAVHFGWGLYQGETLVTKLYSSYNTNLNPGSYLSSTSRPLSFGRDMTSGTYRIVPIYSEYGANNWRPCIGADKNYIEVVINGNTCTFTGHGTAGGGSDYQVNDITFAGHMHNGRPIDITMNMTNNGVSGNKLLHLFLNGTFLSSSFVALEPGETGDIPYRYIPQEAGTQTLTWSWNEDGSNPIATRTITINAMPAATLTGTVEVLNVTDTQNNIITSDKFSVLYTITNNGTTTYDEDITVKLFKRTYGNNGNNVQAKVQPIVLEPGETTTLRFDLENVIDGWKYFTYAYYYSEGSQVSIKGTAAYTIVFPEEPEYIPGDVDDDGSVDINDVTALIDYLLSGGTINMDAADLDGDNSVDINDVTALIDKLLAGA
jgi:hypothetical protein